MTNNIKELIKLRDSTNSQNSEKKHSEISNFLDQEIIQIYKIQNLKFKEEINSLTRNFEALCLKNKEDNNLIKKLEVEINFYKNKMKNSQSNSEKFEEEKNYTMQNLKDEIERQINLIENLELKNQNFAMNCAKAQEKEYFYKTYSTKLDEKNKNLITMNESLEKENSKIKKDLKILKIREEELLKFIDIGEKLKKEKDLSEKLLIESRERIKLLENIIQEQKLEWEQNLEKNLNIVKFELLEKSKQNENLREKLLELENYLKTAKLHFESEIEDRKLQIENLQKENEHIFLLSENQISTWKRNFEKEFEDIISINKNKILKFQTAISEKLSRNENILKSLDKIINNFLASKSRKENLQVNYEDIKYKNYNLMEGIITQLEENLNKKDNLILLKEKRIIELSDEIKQREESFSKLAHENNSLKFLTHQNEKTHKSGLEIFEKKLSNKRIKLSSARREIETISKELDLSRQNLSNSIAEKEAKYMKLFSHIKFPAEKLKLSIDTLLLILPCRSCSDFNKKLHIMDCGHSLCFECIENLKNSNNPCIECKNIRKHISSINPYKSARPIENTNLNDIIIRFQFINQTVEEIDLLINTIKENFHINN